MTTIAINEIKCMACGFTSPLGEMVVAHQAICARLPEEKRDFRLFVVSLIFGDSSDRALEIAATASREQGKEVVGIES